MNFAENQHRKLTEVLPVPDGLRELMADITREVLRFQPKNLEAFIADYLESMLLTRELYIISSQTVDDIVESSLQIVEILTEDGISEEKAKKSVEIIRDEFRRHVVEMEECEPLREFDVMKRLVQECQLSTEQAQKATEVIESAWTFFYRQNKIKILKLTPDFGHSNAVKNTLRVYQKSKVNATDLKKSSQVLETGFQSYFRRKFQEEMAQGNICQGSDANWCKPNFENRSEKATKIQSWYRGAKVHKEFKEKLKAANVIESYYRAFKARKLGGVALKVESKIKENPTEEYLNQSAADRKSVV